MHLRVEGVTSKKKNSMKISLLKLGMGISEYQIQKDPNPKLSRIQIEI